MFYFKLHVRKSMVVYLFSVHIFNSRQAIVYIKYILSEPVERRLSAIYSYTCIQQRLSDQL